MTETLSDKIKTNDLWKPYSEFSFYWATDVREAVKKLIDTLVLEYGWNLDLATKFVLEIFGEKLI